MYSLKLLLHVIQGNSTGSDDLIDPGAGRIKEEIKSLDVGSSVAGDEYNELSSKKASCLGTSSVSASSEVNIAGSSNTTIPGCSLVTEETKSRYNMDKSESDFSSCHGHHDVAGHGSVYVPTQQNSVKVKVELLENIDLPHSERNVLNEFSFNTKPVKSEMGNNELYGDGVDHMRFQDRLKLRTSGENSGLNSFSIPSLRKNLVLSESVEPIRMNRPGKRKKTAT